MNEKYSYKDLMGKSFKDIPAIAITQDNMTIGDYYIKTNPTVDPF